MRFVHLQKQISARVVPSLLFTTLLIVCLTGCKRQESLQLCRPDDQPETFEFEAIPFSWQDSYQLGFMLPNGDSNYVTSRDDLPFIAAHNVRINLPQTARHDGTPIPPEGWTWEVDDIYTEKPVARLVTEQQFRTKLFTHFLGRWVADGIQFQAKLIAESMPESDAYTKRQEDLNRLNDLLKRDKQDQDSEAIDFQKIEIARRWRAYQALQPNPKRLKLDGHFFAENGLLVLGNEAQKKTVKNLNLSREIDTLTNREGRVDSGVGEEFRKVSKFFETLVGRPLKTPFLIQNQRLTECPTLK